MICDRQS